MSDIIIKLPDGAQKELPSGSCAYDVAMSISEGLARAAIAAEVDGKLVDLRAPLSDGEHNLRLLTSRDPESLEILRHTAAHVLAQAVRRLYGDGVQYTIGPALMDDFQYGFYYDLAMPEGVTLSADDLAAIEKEMQKIVKEKLPITRIEMSPEKAHDEMKQRGQRYKVEMIDDMLAADPDTPLSFYEQGEFMDMCRGPHLPDTGKLGKGFKLLSLAGAYWRGDEKNQMLTRIYGIGFFDKKELAERLEKIEEARKRDHRLLGKQLDLFMLDEKVGPGMPIWLPKGAILRMELENWLRGHLQKAGYSMIYSPHIGKIDLFRTSGHFPYYRESQFPPIYGSATTEILWDLAEAFEIEDVAERFAEVTRLTSALALLDPDTYRELYETDPLGTNEQGQTMVLMPEHNHDAVLAKLKKLAHHDVDNFLLKPMNCPFHIQAYKSSQRSYRELPVRLAEFGQVYRWEQSGELNGLTRVRSFTQDDAHIFCTPEQLESEIESCIDLVKLVLGTLGLNDYRVRVSLRDPDSDKYVGDGENWDLAEANIRKVVKKSGMDYTEEIGEAAFYGPKIDFVVKDCLGRDWQLGTVQVDYNLPERFDLEYAGADNKTHRPIMIHRAPFGSFERFIGILIEHYGGAFPLWLAPVQVAVLPVSDKFNDYARQVADALTAADLRVDFDHSPDKVGAKIRRATLQKIPYMLIIGEREQEAGTVSVRARKAGDLGDMTLQELIDELLAEKASRGEETIVLSRGGNTES